MGADAPTAAPLGSAERQSRLKQASGVGVVGEPQSHLRRAVGSRGHCRAANEGNTTGRRADGYEIRITQRAGAGFAPRRLLHSMGEHPR